MTFARVASWESLLFGLVGVAARRAFQWGRHDCAMFAADAVEAMTLADPARAWRGTYRDESGARALIANAGGLDRLATQGLEIEPIDNWRLAQRGDVVLVGRPGDGDPCLGVSMGSRLAIASLDGGVAWLPIASALLVWKL